MNYTILWGHSGRHGHEWRGAREASRYAAVEWGKVRAASPERAVEIFSKESGARPTDWYQEVGRPQRIHVIFAQNRSENPRALKYPNWVAVYDEEGRREWTGSLSDFIGPNLEEDDILYWLRDLYAKDEARMGGGAAPMSVLRWARPPRGKR